MKSLLPISFILALLAAGCATVNKKDLTSAGDRHISPAETGSPFSGSFEKRLFKTTFDIRDHHMTGYTLVKKTSDTSIRVVFTSEIGMTWYDLEFFPGRMVRHTVFGPLDRKVVLNILEQDLRAILYSTEAHPRPQVYRISGSGDYALIGGSTPVNRYRIDLIRKKEGVAQKIILESPALKLRIVLNLFSQ